MKTIIWILGGNCAGKTTQSKLIHQNCNNISSKTIHKVNFVNENNEDDITYYTTFDRTGHVGKIEDNQCTGTDSLKTRAQIEMSYLSLVFDTNIETIVIDGIMSTATWNTMIHQVKIKQDIHSVVILLNYNSPEANFTRLRQRRANKTGQPVSSIELSENTQENVSRKIKLFKTMFDKVKGDFTMSAEIDADLPMLKIHKMITQLANI